MAAGQEAPSPAAGEGGWLYRVRGLSPARDNRPLAVYVLHSRLLAPSALELMCGVLCGDSRFKAKEAWAECLSFPARGFATVDTEAGRVIPAVPEEVWRRLEEYRAR